MNRYFAAVLLVFALVAPAKAASLTISGSLQPNVPWNGTSASPTFTVGIQNPGNVTSPVIGWQLGLTIVAQGGAAGTLDFASFAPPSNYLFATDSGGMIRLSPALPFASIIVNDVATDNGVVVPATGDNLLALTFSITAGTHGTFNIEAVGNATSGSGWIPNVAPFPTNAFDNVPFGNTPVTIGTVTVTPASVVPEPQSAVLLMSGLVTLLAWRRVRRGRR